MAKRLKQLMKQDRVCKVFGMGPLCDPKIIEMVAMANWYDAVWLDQEHSALTFDQICHGVRAARASGIDCFVRLAPTDYATVMRPLEAGAGGIMAAQIRSVDQAAEVIHWAKFHPLGLRGVNSGGIDGGYGTMSLAEYMAKANDETYVILQIEHIDAVKVVEKIAALPGLDGLFIGPADLTQSMGLTAQWEHPEVVAAIQRVARACADRKVPWSILPMSPVHAKKYIEMGCRMLSIGFDMWFVHRGVKNFREEYSWLD